ncbi:MAG: RNA 2',3'-cyclic phosphodiesterase [Pyrinomonadaceae bacterium]|nr:RNA 2',3'-cyclic phosphodiesterase [Pyrinomonadaceae bacterium]
MTKGTKGRPATSETWRIFCAIDLPASVRASLLSRVKSLREAVPNAQPSWSREENIHLTLKFLGQVQTSRLSDLSKAAARSAADFSPFQVTLEDTGMFPKHGAPRVLWIGVKDEAGKLAHLQTRLEEECASEGFAREVRPFHPHLTIARLRNPQGARELAVAHKKMRFEPAEVAVAELLVIRSEPSGAGSRYTVISRHRMD